MGRDSRVWRPRPRESSGTPGQGIGRALLAAALLALALAGCERAGGAVTTTPNGSRLELPPEAEPVEFPAGTVRIHSDGQIHVLRAELAETPAQRERGLMYRTAMPEDAGMLFLYPAEQEGGFWMYNTRIPLSIAYADAEGVIFQIREMQPCESPYASLCPTYPAQRPFRYALEVNQGYFARRGIGVGARIEYQRDGGVAAGAAAGGNSQP